MVFIILSVMTSASAGMTGDGSEMTPALSGFQPDISVYIDSVSSTSIVPTEDAISPLDKPAGYIHRPIVELFSGLSCPACMNGVHQDIERLYHEAEVDPSVPYTGISFHELNGRGVDDLATDESLARMRHYQPGVSGTPDLEIDGGWIELGGMAAPGGDITYSNALAGVDAASDRDGGNPLRPIQNAINGFKYVTLDVMEAFQGDALGVTVTVTYHGTSSSVLSPDLNGELYIFIVERNVTAHSVVLKEDVMDNNVFRGYAVEGQAVSLGPGESTTLSGGWAIPDGLKVPVKPFDLYAVAAVYDLDDTSSQDGTGGNKAQVPRALQSGTAYASAYDQKNEPPQVKSTMSTDAGDGMVTISAQIEDDEGLMSAYLLVATDDSGLNWTSEMMTLTGEELCDDSGVCYAFGSGGAEVTFEPPEGWNGTYVVVATDTMGVSSRSVPMLASYIPGSGESTLAALELILNLMLPFILFAGIFLLVFIIFRRSREGRETKNLKIGLVICIVLAIIVSSYAIAAHFTVDEAPDFTVTDTTGKEVTLSQFRGQVVLLDIMSTTCSGCEKAMKAMQDIHPEYGGQVQFISVSIAEEDSVEDMKNYKEEKGGDWIFAYDDDMEIYSAYSIQQIPRIIIIDSEGRVTYDHLGAPSKDELGQSLEDAINKDAQIIGIYSVTGIVGLVLMAIGAGATMFFAPCAFPLLPAYLSYTLQKRDVEGTVLNGFKLGGVASLGIITVFMIVGVLVASAGRTVSQYLHILEPIIGILLVVFGIILFMKIKLPLDRINCYFRNLLDRIRGRDPNMCDEDTGSKMDMFFYGMGYAGGAASCMAPIMLLAVFKGMTAGGFLGGIVTFVILALAMSTMMIGFSIMATVGGATALQKYNRHIGKIEKGSAVILMIVGIYFLYNFLALA